MLFSKEGQEVIITTRLLIHTCLKCEHKEDCEDKHNLVKFLEANDNYGSPEIYGDDVGEED